MASLPAVCLPEHRSAILWAAILASSMGFIDSSVTAIALPAIRTALHASLTAAQWISGAYLLALAALLLVGGAAGDRFGTARMFGLGIALFVISSLGCAAAFSPVQIVAARAVQGMAAALMVPSSMAIIGRAYPRAERGRALGLWAAASTATTALGPVLGGIILTYGGDQAWRWIFALNLPLGALAFWLLWRRALPDPGQPGVPIDLVGGALATAGLGLMAWALSAQSNAAVTGLIGMVCFAAFLAWEARTPHPMIRLQLFANRAFSATNLATFLLYFSITGISFFLPMVAISAWHVSALEVTAAFLPISVLIAVLSAPVGRLADRIGPGPLMTAGAVLVGLSQIGLALTAPLAAFWQACVPLMVVSGLGMALVVAPLTVAVMAAATDAEQGAASGINNAVARTASLAAVAVMGRLAAQGYGAAGGAGLPGFGLTATGPAHAAATAIAFAAITAVAAVAAILSAVVAAWGLRR